MNCVSRLRNLARVIPGDKICRTLFSRQTLLQCPREDLIWRSVGRLQMKGREQVEDVLELNVVNAIASFRTCNAPANDPAKNSDREPQG